MDTIYDGDPRVIETTNGWSCTADNGTVYYLHAIGLSNGATARITNGDTSCVIGWELVSADQTIRLEFVECWSPDRAFASVLGDPRTLAAAA